MSINRRISDYHAIYHTRHAFKLPAKDFLDCFNLRGMRGTNFYGKYTCWLLNLIFFNVQHLKNSIQLIFLQTHSNIKLKFFSKFFCVTVQLSDTALAGPSLVQLNYCRGTGLYVIIVDLREPEKIVQSFMFWHFFQ